MSPSLAKTTHTLLALDPADVGEQLALLSDADLDGVIEITDNAAMVNRLARIERGRRTEKMEGSRSVLPGRTQTQTERHRRSEEMAVAAWVDATDEAQAEVRKGTGWKKLVIMARAYLREATPAAPEAAAVAEPSDWTDGDTTLLFGDFRDRLAHLPDGSVDLIVTDPPYPKDDLPLWSDLAKHAARLLGPRGILFAWAGQIFLPEVIDRLGEHLTYGWTFSLQLPGSGSRIMGRHIIQAWKPVLAFTVGTWPSGEWGDDVLLSPTREKDLYEWEQNPDPALRLIERYSPPDGLIVDPFLGVGSFGVAARNAGRRFVGVELDDARFAKSVERLTP